MDNTTPALPDLASSRRSAWRNPVKYAKDRLAKLADIACEPCRLVKAPVWLLCIACMRDQSGREIERHLLAMREEFRIRVYDVALAQRVDLDGVVSYLRTWTDWRARRLATICIFLAYLCQRSRYHGVVVWMVRGIPKGAIAVATRLRATRLGQEVLQQPSLRCVYTDLEELTQSGLLIRAQFAWNKVPPWACGQPKKDAKGRITQWAYSYYFLTVCPFDTGLSGRITPAPRGKPIAEFRVDARPALVVEVSPPLVEAIRPTTSEPAQVPALLAARPLAAPDVPLLQGEAELIETLRAGGVEGATAENFLKGWRNSQRPDSGPDPPDDDDS